MILTPPSMVVPDSLSNLGQRHWPAEQPTASLNKDIHTHDNSHLMQFWTCYHIARRWFLTRCKLYNCHRPSQLLAWTRLVGYNAPTTGNGDYRSLHLARSVRWYEPPRRCRMCFGSNIAPSESNSVWQFNSLLGLATEGAVYCSRGMAEWPTRSVLASGALVFSPITVNSNGSVWRKDLSCR